MRMCYYFRIHQGWDKQVTILYIRIQCAHARPSLSHNRRQFASETDLTVRIRPRGPVTGEFRKKTTPTSGTQDVYPDLDRTRMECAMHARHRHVHPARGRAMPHKNRHLTHPGPGRARPPQTQAPAPPDFPRAALLMVEVYAASAEEGPRAAGNRL